VDEVTFLIRLLKDNWSVAAIKAGLTGHKVSTVDFIDVRSIEPGKGNRVDLDSGAVVVVYEDSATLEHPTIDYSVRNETYGMTVHLRVLHRRDFTSVTFSRDRLESLYRITRYIIERNGRRPKIHVDKNAHLDENDALNVTAIEENADLIQLTSRSEANDRKKKLLGYKMPVTIKRFGRSV
tara:strand:+ start:12150 stop:12692 length:543 start_codon:yes stop_codon:yes gene_type:complete